MDCSPENKHIGRRSFCTIGLLLVNGLISLTMAVPLIGFMIAPIFKNTHQKFVVLGIVDLLKGSRHKRINYTFEAQDGWVRSNKKRSVYVTDRGHGNFVVLSRSCSHLNCLVRWETSRERFICPCHGGIFDEEGNVLRGPPQRPLERLQTKITNGVLYVKES